MDFLGMNGGSIATVITMIVTLLAVFGAWSRVERVLKALKEISDVIAFIPLMLADKKVSDEEIKELETQFKEAIESVKAITGK